jgi:hypothetical protein
MADWYAQNSSVNVNSAAEWKSSDGGTTLTWPPSSGDNLYANGKTAIALNVGFDIGTGKLSTEAGAGTTGGFFNASATVTITANIVAGGSNCVVINSANVPTFIGNITGSASGNFVGLQMGTRTAFTEGNITADVGVGVNITTGSLTNTGNIVGSSTTASKYGVAITSGSLTNSGGSITGGSAASASGVCATVAGNTITQTGDVVGGSGSGACGILNGYGLTTVNSGNLIDTATASAFFGIQLIYNPGPTNYHRMQAPGSTTKDYYYDIPTVGNVTEDDTVAGATGTYHEATVAEVQDGVFFGAGSALEGTYAGGGGGGGRPEFRGGNL